MPSFPARILLTRNLKPMATAQRGYRVRSTCPPGTRIAAVRSHARLHAEQARLNKEQGRAFTTTRVASATKDSQDRESLNPTSTEYSKSGGGDASAAHEAEAFDPKSTRPEEEGGRGKGDSLNVSPGSSEVNQSKEAENKATAKSPSESSSQSGERNRQSSGGSPAKNGPGASDYSG